MKSITITPVRNYFPYLYIALAIILATFLAFYIIKPAFMLSEDKIHVDKYIVYSAAISLFIIVMLFITLLI